MIVSNSIDKNRFVVVLGAGSIGERHINNLLSNGYQNVIVFRQRNQPFRNVDASKVKVTKDWQDVLDHNCLAAIICTPTSQHLPQVEKCLQANMHVLVEKPLSDIQFNNQELGQIILEKKLLLQVGYMLRYHPLLQQIKQMIDEKKFGMLLNVQTFWGEYLPHWHPWEDYHSSYAASPELGGGAGLTLSHDIDVVNFLVGDEIKNHQFIKNYSSHLGINSESACDINLEYQNNVTAHIHVNFFQKIAQRTYKIILENAVIDLDYFAAEMLIRTEDKIEKILIKDFDRNDLFIAQQKDFFDKINSKDTIDFSQKQIAASYNILKILEVE